MGFLIGLAWFVVAVILIGLAPVLGVFVVLAIVGYGAHGIVDDAKRNRAAVAERKR